MRYRRNINCLSADELHDLREALAAIYALPAADPNSFATLASFHGGPPTTCCAHGAPGQWKWSSRLGAKGLRLKPVES